MTAKPIQDENLASIIRAVLLPITGVIAVPLLRAQAIRQTQNSLTTLFPGDSNNRYSGVLQMLKKMYTQEGFLNMYRGASIYAVTKLLDIFFFKHFTKEFKQFVQKQASREKQNPGSIWHSNWLSSAPMLALLSSSPSLLLLQPLNYLSTNLYTDLGTKQTRKYKGVLDCIQQTYRQSGILPFFRGTFANLMAIPLYRAAYFSLFGLTQPYVGSPKGQPKNAASLLALKFAVAQTVTLMAGAFTYPIKVVTARLQLQFTRGEQPKQFSTVLGGFKYIIANEGFRPLYNGMVFVIGRSIAASLLLVAYDHL